MTAAERFSALLGEEINDALAGVLLDEAKQIIINFCHLETMPPGLEGAQARLAVKAYNRMGQEGSASYSEGGKSQSFDALLDADLRRELYAYRKLVR